MRDGLQVQLVGVELRELAAPEAEAAAEGAEGNALAAEVGSPPEAGPRMERFELVAGQRLVQAQALLRVGTEKESTVEFASIPELTDEENVFIALNDPGRYQVRISLPTPAPEEPADRDEDETALSEAT